MNSVAAQRQVGTVLPEVGQLVRVRDRHWVVTNLIPSSLSTSPGERASNLVELSSVEDDGFGDELTVFWETEPGTLVLPKATLPTPTVGGFDEPGRLRAFLDAVRWGAIASADARTLQAPFRSGITIEDYQLDPVVRALQMPRVNLFIADDVGLGKTIEAGLVAQELLLRHRVRTILIVCPASLGLKWQDEMRDRFGLDFHLVDSDAVKQLRRDRGIGANIWTHFPRLIVSIDWLKRPRAMALLDEILPSDSSTYPRKFDLLIVDEVHQCAPAGRGVYASDSLRTVALKKIAPHFEHRLFLSATPHNGYTESFTALLELLDPQRFARGVKPSQAAMARSIVRRLKSELRKELPPRADGSPYFPERHVLPLKVAYPDSERMIHATLQRYASSRRRQARATTSQSATDFVTLLLKKRLFSSPKAFFETLLEHLATLRKRGTAASVTEAQLRAEFERIEEDSDTDDAVMEATRDALATAARALEPITQEQEALLAEMLAWAEQEAPRADAKATVLIRFLDATCRPTGAWNDERVIVFTEYRDTQQWLHQLFVNHGVPAERIALMYGGMDKDKREKIKAEFQAPTDRSPVRILLATDAASEGIDLQLQCHRIVHVEIPFSPTRLEQRNGRVDRHGQPSPVVMIYHFVGEGFDAARSGQLSIDSDLEFLFRIALKMETIRDDLGTAGQVLALQVEEAMLGRRTVIDDASIEKARARASRTVLKLERNLREDIKRLREQLDVSVRDLGISPAAVERVVSTALALARQPALKPVAGKAGAFKVGALSQAWALAKLGLADPLSGIERPLSFDHAVADNDRDVVLAHLGHRLVAQSTRLLRAEIWKTGGEKSLHRVSACIVPNEVAAEITAVAHARFVVTGGSGHRLHEEIITAAGHVRNGRFSRLNVSQVRAALAASTEQAVPPAVEKQLAGEWPAIEDAVYRVLEARAGDVMKGLERTLAERAEAESVGVAEVLEELRRGIEAQIADYEGETGRQLRLQFKFDEEPVQFEDDLAKLRQRLAKIPCEVEREQEAVRRRYGSPQFRLFPAALTFLVPVRLAQISA